MRIRLLTEVDRAGAPEGTIVGSFNAPPGMEDEVEPIAETFILDVGDHLEISVPWQPDEIDVARLAHGGTVWLTTIGALFPHRLEVRGSDGRPSPPPKERG
jgi:hypothetical protein